MPQLESEKEVREDTKYSATQLRNWSHNNFLDLCCFHRC